MPTNLPDDVVKASYDAALSYRQDQATDQIHHDFALQEVIARAIMADRGLRADPVAWGHKDDFQKPIGIDGNFRLWHEKTGDWSTPLFVSPVAGWQPIETAPKDGTTILGYYYGKILMAHWEADGSENRGGEPAWIDGSFDKYEEFFVYPLTHWMPLPSAPAAEKQEG